MLISGKKLSNKVIKKIKKDLEKLSSKNITPKIAIVTAGPDTSWKVYVRRKIKLADELSIQKVLINLTKDNEDKILEVVQDLNADKTVHGIIVQRPLPESIDIESVIKAINPEKDIDGFRSDSKFTAPIWLAIELILKDVYKQIRIKASYYDWLKEKQISIIGKGETGGKPIIDGLQKMNIKADVIDSKTQNKSEILKHSDIIISAVGKRRVVEAKDIKKGVLLIGIGLHRGEDEKLHGDYEESDIENTASFYTPTPGGVGPLNLSYLFSNLVKAAIIQLKQ